MVKFMWPRHFYLPRRDSLENRGADTPVCRVETHLDAFRERSKSAISRDFHPLLCAGQARAYSPRRASGGEANLHRWDFGCRDLDFDACW